MKSVPMNNTYTPAVSGYSGYNARPLYEHVPLSRIPSAGYCHSGFEMETALIGLRTGENVIAVVYAKSRNPISYDDPFGTDDLVASHVKSTIKYLDFYLSDNDGVYRAEFHNPRDIIEAAIGRYFQSNARFGKLIKVDLANDIPIILAAMEWMNKVMTDWRCFDKASSVEDVVKLGSCFDDVTNLQNEITFHTLDHRISGVKNRIEELKQKLKELEIQSSNVYEKGADALNELEKMGYPNDINDIHDPRNGSERFVETAGPAMDTLNDMVRYTNGISTDHLNRTYVWQSSI